MKQHVNWEHEHFFDENDSAEHQIVLALLDPQNA